MKLPKSCNKRLGFPLRQGIDNEVKWVTISASRLESDEGVQEGRSISPRTNFFIVGLNLLRKASISPTMEHSLSDKQDGDDSAGKVNNQIITIQVRTSPKLYRMIISPRDRLFQRPI